MLDDYDDEEPSEIDGIDVGSGWRMTGELEVGMYLINIYKNDA